MVNVPEAGAEDAGLPSQAVFKIYSIISLTTLTALAASFFFVQGAVSLGTIMLLLFLALFALQVVLLASAEHYLRFAIILNSLGWALPFYAAISFYFIITFGFLILFLFLAGRRGKDELDNSLKIKVSRVVRAVVGLSLTAVVIFTFVSMILAGKIALTEDKVRDLTETVVSPLAKHYVKDFSPDMPTGVFFAGIAERNIAIAANRAAVNQSVAELKREIENYIGAEVDLRRSVSGNLYQALQFKINTLTPQAKLYWALIILGIIFLSIKSIEFLVALPLTLLVFILYQALLVFNFASVGLKDRSQEVVILR